MSHGTGQPVRARGSEVSTSEQQPNGTEVLRAVNAELDRVPGLQERVGRLGDVAAPVALALTPAALVAAIAAKDEPLSDALIAEVVRGAMGDAAMVLTILDRDIRRATAHGLRT